MEILSIKKKDIFKSSYKKDLMLKKHKDKLNPSRNKHFTQNCPQSPMKSLYHPREAQQRIFILELVGHWNRRLDSTEEKCPLGPQMFSFRGRAPQKLCAGSRWVQSPLSLWRGQFYSFIGKVAGPSFHTSVGSSTSWGYARGGVIPYGNFRDSCLGHPGGGWFV